METVKRTQGCWTCKKRKIGCDRGYPACNNCLRTGRECLGYGIRLAWPDQPDGRRRSGRTPDRAVHCSPHNPADYGKQFLNMTYEDLMHSGKGLMALNELLLIRGPQRPARSVPLLPSFPERDSHLLAYYNQRLSWMISTINVKNGFRDDLIPMALYNRGQASHGLRNAIFAVAAFHLWGAEQALSYKAEAIRSLSSSLSATESFDTTETQLATSMMLCVYNVFDETEGNWSMHLYGAQKILHRLASIHGGYLTYSFLYTWFLYHEVLGGFSHPEQQYPHGPASIQLLRDARFDTTVIIGSLGCSVEVMEVISHVNTWRAIDQQDPAVFPEQERSKRAIEYKTLESKLMSLTQRLDPEHDRVLTQHDRTRTLATAELYRVATFLYLHRVGNTENSHDIRSTFLQQALTLLGSLEVCTSPWPLFVIACETETDDQRIRILRTLDRMDEERRIGNVFVLRHIIESFWKQQDLQADSGRAGNLKWWDTIDLNLNVPWFI